MQNIIIDEDFRNLLPPLSKDTYAALEENLIQNGCRDSLVLWNGTLVDGHNRYEICTRLDIPYNTVDKEFDSKDEALIWIITTQVARRNLSPRLLSYYRGLHYRTDKKIKGTYSRGERELNSSQNGDYQNRTVGKLAEIYNVSKNTIGRDGKGADAVDAIGEVSPEAKRMILAEAVRIDKKDLQALASASREEVAEVAMQIEEGTYEQKKTMATTQDDSPTPVDSIISGMLPLDKAIGKVSDIFTAALSNITNGADRTKLQKALRDYIDTLEELYKAI